MLKYILPALNIAISVSWYQVADFQFDMNVHFRDGEYFFLMSIKTESCRVFIQDQVSVHAIKDMTFISIDNKIKVCFEQAEIPLSWMMIIGLKGSNPHEHLAKYFTLYLDLCR
jgi:hypothetical protein